MRKQNTHPISGPTFETTVTRKRSRMAIAQPPHLALIELLTCRNYLHVVKRRRERRREQLLDDLTEKIRYWNLKGEALRRFRGELALEEQLHLS